jgi:hypothetical protein
MSRYGSQRRFIDPSSAMSLSTTDNVSRYGLSSDIGAYPAMARQSNPDVLLDNVAISPSRHSSQTPSASSSAISFTSEPSSSPHRQHPTTSTSATSAFSTPDPLANLKDPCLSTSSQRISLSPRPPAGEMPLPIQTHLSHLDLIRLGAIQRMLTSRMKVHQLKETVIFRRCRTGHQALLKGQSSTAA